MNENIHKNLHSQALKELLTRSLYRVGMQQNILCISWRGI